MKLKDRIAIVTGAGRGIGRGIAETMAKEGAKIIVADISEKRGEEVVASLRNISEALFKKVDVTNSDEIREVVVAVCEKYGKIDILVNNAGIAQLENFLEGEEKKWDRIISVNLKGLILFSRAVLERMVGKKYGKIINIASVAGEIAYPSQVVYSASKGGVIAFTRSLAAEMATHHINVNAISPGFTETPGTGRNRELLPDYFQKLEKSIPWGRAGRPEDIGKIAVFLASDDSEYMTGQCIVVDGGAAGV